MKKDTIVTSISNVDDLINILTQCPHDLPVLVDGKIIHSIELNETGIKGYEEQGNVRIISKDA